METRHERAVPAICRHGRSRRGSPTTSSGRCWASDFGRRWWIGFAVSAALTLVMLVAIVWLFWKGVGVWGINTSNVWGFALANYVWWIGIGNAGTLISCHAAADAAALARRDQPLRRGDDAVRRRHRRASSRSCTWAGRGCSTGWFPIPHAGAFAAMAEPAGLGLLRHRQLPAGLDDVLVHRRAARLRDAARPGDDAAAARCLWRARARLAGLGPAVAGLAELLRRDGRARRAAGGVGALGCRAGFRRRA